MSKIDIRDSQCENCRKFSHCNNNDLVCISKFQQLKAENEELKKVNKQLATYYPQESNELLKVKLENEELKKQLQEESDLGHKAVQEEADSFFEALKYKQCLDDIEEIADKSPCCSCLDEILQKIKEVNNNG